MQRGKVKEKNLSFDGDIIGTQNENPILNSLTYDVEFEYGEVREHMDNTIGENVLTMADADCHVTMALQAILNHRKYETTCELKDKNFYVNNHKKLRNFA